MRAAVARRRAAVNVTETVAGAVSVVDDALSSAMHRRQFRVDEVRSIFGPVVGSVVDDAAQARVRDVFDAVVPANAGDPLIERRRIIDALLDARLLLESRD